MFERLISARDNAILELQKQNKKTCRNMIIAGHQAVREIMLSSFPFISAYYTEVECKCDYYGKPLRFKLNHFGKSGVTEEREDHIAIILGPSIDKRGPLEVLVHELGEADYIASRMPSFKDSHDRDRVRFQLVEVLSHKYISERLREQKLVLDDSKVLEIGRLLATKISAESKEDLSEWELILNHLWIISSFDNDDLRRYLPPLDDVALMKMNQALELVETINSNTTTSEMYDIAFSLLEILETAGLSGISVRPQAKLQ